MCGAMVQVLVGAIFRCSSNVHAPIEPACKLALPPYWLEQLESVRLPLSRTSVKIRPLHGLAATNKSMNITDTPEK